MNSQPSPRPLRLWQFRIRDGLAIITICAILLGWWGDRTRLRRELDATHDLRDLLEQERSRVAQLEKRNDALLTQITRVRPPLIELDRTPTVYGIVRAVRVVNANMQLVEISVGQDDGLQEGMELQVYRLSTTRPLPLGKIKLTRVEADVAVGQVVTLESGCAIQRHDYVTARITPQAP